MDKRKRMYTLQESAVYLAIGLRSVQYEVAAGNLIARYYGRKPLIPVEELDQWIARQPTEPPAR